MEFLPRHKLAVGGLAAAAALCGALALAAPSASASSDPAPPGVTSGGGAVDLQGNPVQTRTYVGDEPPGDLGDLQCAATVSADGTVTETAGDCTGLQASAP